MVPLTDRPSAENPSVVSQLQNAHLIYILGGFPGYLAAVLRESPSAGAIQKAHGNGAVIAGSSAGAMVLCSRFYDPYEKKTDNGLGMVEKTAVIPHYNRAGFGWEKALLAENVAVMGIDEQTAIVDDGPGGQWQVIGKGHAALIRRDEKTVFGPGTLLPAITASQRR